MEALLKEVKEPKPMKNKEWVKRKKPLKKSYKRIPPKEYTGMRESWVLEKWIIEVESYLEWC